MLGRDTYACTLVVRNWLSGDGHVHRGVSQNEVLGKERRLPTQCCPLRNGLCVVVTVDYCFVSSHLPSRRLASHRALLDATGNHAAHSERLCISPARPPDVTFCGNRVRPRCRTASSSNPHSLLSCRMSRCALPFAVCIRISQQRSGGRCRERGLCGSCRGQ